MSYLKNPSDQLVINQINTDNDINLLISDVKLGDPLEGTQSGNTDMAVIANPGLYFGSVMIHFDRLELKKMFKNISVVVDVADVPADTAELLPYFNDKYGLQLQTTEIDNVVVDPENLGEQDLIKHTITVIDTLSKAYFGAVDVLIRIMADETYDNAITTELGEPLATEDGNYYLAY